MSKKEREKGARGEREVCEVLREMGFEAERMAGMEANRKGTVHFDVRARVPGGDWWEIQVKNVAKRCPTLPEIMANATLGMVKFTEGPTRGKWLFIGYADDLEMFARDVMKAQRASECEALGERR